MSLLRRLLLFLGLPDPQTPRTFELESAVFQSLNDLAAREQRTPEEMAALLLSQAIQQRWVSEETWQHWQALTAREQEITALVCLNLTTRQIAARLRISPETVKSHIRNVLSKFGLHNREDLRRALAGWDFSAWDLD